MPPALEQRDAGISEVFDVRIVERCGINQGFPIVLRHSLSGHDSVFAQNSLLTLKHSLHGLWVTRMSPNQPSDPADVR
jgi:hypothetical protein